MKKFLGLALFLVAGSASATYCGTGGTTHWNASTGMCEANVVAQAPVAPQMGQQQNAEGTGTGTGTGTATASGVGTGTSGVTTSSNDVSKSLALGVMLPKIDGLPALPKLACPSANYYQESQGGFGWGLVTTRGHAKADSIGCEVVQHYNSMIDNCRWASAANLQAARLSNIVPNYKPAEENGLINLSTHECSALRMKPAISVVLPLTGDIHPRVVNKNNKNKKKKCGCKK